MARRQAATDTEHPDPLDGAQVRERERLAAVARYDILDTPPDGAFDRVAALAARVVGTPIGAVTIVDTDRIWFAATHGLDGVTQIDRDPGLCASAILADEPYLVTDAAIDPRTFANPLVCGKLGLRFYAAAPLITADGHRLGTVNVLDTEPREISAQQLETLQDLAAVVMDELELRLSAITTLRSERVLRQQAEADTATIESFASTLQRSLLPPTLPEIAGVDLACHYHAASPREVGGDFYDVFSLGGGRWAFFLGDVCGHGAEAAALTSLIRYTLRAAAWHDPDPIAALRELNTILWREPTRQHRFATVLFGTLQPAATGPGVQITLAGGGHPYPLHLYPTPARSSSALSGAEGVVVREVTLEGGMLVGALASATFTCATLHLAPGETLLLYTDGLTEAHFGGTLWGERRLTDFLSRRPRFDAASVVADLTDLIATFAPAPADDIALLALSVLATDVGGAS